MTSTARADAGGAHGISIGAVLRELLGKGDALMLNKDSPKPRRIQVQSK